MSFLVIMTVLRRYLFLACCFLSMLPAAEAAAQRPSLPEEAQTTWIVDEPEEIITHLAFDPATVSDRLPASLKFLTFGELAEGGHGGARAHLAKYPEQAGWGISFFEIVRQGTFEIDGRAPRFPEHGAVALWFAGVRPVDSTSTAEPGRLALELWMPDSAYVTYMRGKRHYATYGEVRLRRRPDGTWLGSVEVDGLRVEGTCMPKGNERELGPGGNVVYPPATSEVQTVVRTTYAGHREKQCAEASWEFTGTHPLTNAMEVGASVFQYGYDLLGGAYGH